MGPNHSAAGNLKTSWDKSPPHYEAHFHTSKDTPGRLRAALPAGPSGRHGLTIHAEGANPSRPMQPRGVEAARRDAFFLPWEQVLETRRMPSTSGHGRGSAEESVKEPLFFRSRREAKSAERSEAESRGQPQGLRRRETRACREAKARGAKAEGRQETCSKWRGPQSVRHVRSC